MQPVARDLGDIIVEALERNPLFISAALPHRVYPPMFNRYEGGMHFGSHVDGAVRIVPGSGAKIRTDLSATLFLSRPRGLRRRRTAGRGHLRRADGQASRRTHGRLSREQPAPRRAGDARRARRVLLWVQSLVRDDGQRACCSTSTTRSSGSNATGGDETARMQLTGCYHNLLRMWTQT